MQAQRDLGSAGLILKQNGPIEHVAWFCEQSFEKTVKYVYAFFKLKMQNGNLESVHSKMRERAHFHTDDLVINMSRELYRGYAEIVFANVKVLTTSLPEELKVAVAELMEKLPKNVIGEFDKMFDRGRDRIDKLMGDKGNYNASLMKSTSDSLADYLRKFEFGSEIDDIVNDTIKAFVQNTQITSPFFGPAIYKKHANFPVKAAALSPWILPYAETSRYPLKECAYINLKIFRDYEGQLRPYFASLIVILEQLQKEADEYIESLQEFKKAMSPSD